MQINNQQFHSFIETRSLYSCISNVSRAVITSMNSSEMYTERSLFGGAISCEIPTSWRDVADVRQVPDHQEVWQDMNGAVLIVEILQRQEVDDQNAASFFFNDLAESNGIARADDLSFRPATSSLAVQIQGANACAGIGYQKVAMGRDHDIISGRPRENQEILWTCVELCALRLARVGTDLLVTVTKPLSNPNEPPTSSVAWSEPLQKAISSMQIRDWGLFG
jgi:hypothetical protein